MNKITEIMKSTFFSKTFIKYVIVGIINTLFGAMIMFFSYNILHVNYWIATVSNYFFASILSYILNKRYTFKNQIKGFAVILRFILNIIVCYSLAFTLSKILVTVFVSNLLTEVADNVAMIIGSGIYIILNYFGQRFIVFTEKGGISNGKRQKNL